MTFCVAESAESRHALGAAEAAAAAAPLPRDLPDVPEEALSELRVSSEGPRAVPHVLTTHLLQGRLLQAAQRVRVRAGKSHAITRS